MKERKEGPPLLVTWSSQTTAVGRVLRTPLENPRVEDRLQVDLTLGKSRHSVENLVDRLFPNVRQIALLVIPLPLLL